MRNEYPTMLSLNTLLLVSVFLLVVNGHDMKGRKELAQAVGVPVGRRLGGRLVTTLVATINPIIFFIAKLRLAPASALLSSLS